MTLTCRSNRYPWHPPATEPRDEPPREWYDEGEDEQETEIEEDKPMTHLQAAKRAKDAHGFRAQAVRWPLAYDLAAQEIARLEAEIKRLRDAEAGRLRSDEPAPKRFQ